MAYGAFVCISEVSVACKDAIPGETRVSFTLDTPAVAACRAVMTHPEGSVLLRVLAAVCARRYNPRLSTSNEESKCQSVPRSTNELSHFARA